MKASIGDVVLPGDYCEEITVAGEKTKVIIGPGLRRELDRVYITKAGVLKKRNPCTYWVDSYQKRYVPSRGENVIGVVVQKAGDIFRVDVGGSITAALSYLSFEGATKKNRPEVQMGDIVYAKMLVASKDMEPELVCVDSHGKKGRLGVLSDGFLFKCSLNLVRKILNPSCPLLESLKNEWPFEMAAGMNGRIWIKANSMRETIALGNAILGAEYQSDEEIKLICSNIASILAGHIS
ncbi:exosome complex component RRP40 [Danaus plexippus]|uniref:Exosome complex component RRP40 n=1 Tax=Danaus plexippus plexippus TaxID=278856 RepID=A0A212ER29_DANPL|nr:exosome complex component RRP40 [Danaus plexippus]OWR43935.1 exosome complex exonuclease Rrp40 [Danaus plexippus plexippus]